MSYFLNADRTCLQYIWICVFMVVRHLADYIFNGYDYSGFLFLLFSIDIVVFKDFLVLSNFSDVLV